MRSVSIAGVGLTQVSEHWERSLADLFVEAAVKAIEDAGVGDPEAVYVANSGSSYIQGQLNLGAMMADALGKAGTPAFTVEAGAASGAVAFHEGVKAVASGLYDIVLVGGVEKVSDASPEEIACFLSMPEDQEYTAYTGITNFGLNALIYRHYMERFGVRQEDIAMLAVRCHEHAEGCPHAMYPFKLSLERILSSPMEADPLHILECSGTGDGAAAVIIQPSKGVDGEVEVAAYSLSTDLTHITERPDIVTFEAVKRASEKAFRMAGISRRDVDVVEIHDETTITGIISLEDMGFAEKGKGATLFTGQEPAAGGKPHVNTFGGLKARGNPVGATGLYQIVEIAMQLEGEAGRCQVDKPEFGLAQSLGGLGSTCAITILRRH
ncbi:thiolase domain-containing protein [Candidatus Bathyarchaeota archaeon]|nr:thiolase domain-containing protein [Candidatus Bathyarchaeota archaeon]